MHAPTDRRLRYPGPSFPEFVALVAFMMGLTAFGVDNTLPAFPALGAHFGVADATELQLVVFVYMTGFGVAQLVYGPLSDTGGRRPVFFVGLLIYGIGCALALVASDFTTLLAARFVQGCGAAAGRVLAVAIVRDRYTGRDMARVMSLTTVVFIMVPIFAPAIGSLLLLLGGWRAIFTAMLALGIAFGAWFFLRMPETLSPALRLAFSSRAIAGGFAETVRTRVALGYSTAFGLQFAAIMGYVGSSQQIFAGEVYGLGGLFPVVFASIALMMGVAALANSRLVRRYGMHRISHGSMLLFCGLSIVQCGLALVCGGHPPLASFWIVLGLSHFATSLCMPNFNALAMEPLGHVAGTASSFIGFYTTVLGAVLGGLAGRAFDGSVTPLAVAYLILSVATVAVVLVTERGRLFGAIHDHPPG